MKDIELLLTEFLAFDADLVESELSRMNSAADEINILENKLNQKRKIHEKLVLNFTTDLGNAKAKVTTEQIQNSAEFYQKMKEGRKEFRRTGIIFLKATA